MTRVEAPARLHFGLLSLPVAGEQQPDFPSPLRGGAREGFFGKDPDFPSPLRGGAGEGLLEPRQFGGVGLMIDSPKVVVRASSTNEWRATGTNSARALAFAQRFISSLPDVERRAFVVEVETCPEEHTGLGSGTALALATAKALAIETGHGDLSVVELAKRVGRGERSAVGIHGFEHGGLIVEAGKRRDEAIAPLVGHYAFPAEWRIVLARPRVEARWHGALERRVFRSLARQNPTDALCRIILTGLLPALAAKDLDAFGEALHEYNARAGEAFSAEQGGTYASPEVAETVAWFRKQGIRGVGQSSWGPTVFAIVGDDEVATRIEREIGQLRFIADHQACVGSATGGRV